MGAIEREGYVFGVEFSQLTKTAAIHVTKNGQFLQEFTFPFLGNEPEQGEIERVIGDFLENRSSENI